MRLEEEHVVFPPGRIPSEKRILIKISHKKIFQAFYNEKKTFSRGEIIPFWRIKIGNIRIILTFMFSFKNSERKSFHNLSYLSFGIQDNFSVLNVFL